MGIDIKLFPCDLQIGTHWFCYQLKAILEKLRTLTLIPLGGGGGAFMAPPVIFYAVHLDRLEFRVQTSWLFSLKSPAYFDI